MKKLFLLLLLISFNTLLFGQKLKTNSEFSFYENKGQIIDQKGNENPRVKYLYQSNGLNVQIKKEGFSYDVYEVKKTLKKKSKKREKDFLAQGKKRPDYDYNYQFHRVDIDFVSANKNPEIIAEGQSEDYDNYYNIPNQPKGVEKVHRFQKITYKNLYPKIDLVFFKSDDTLKPIEYNFIVNPGGKISDIQLKFNGAKTKLKDGKLSTKLRFGEMQENIPHSWEENGNAKNAIGVEFTDLGSGIFGFKSEKNASDKVVVIDPVPTRMWGSYFAGNGDEFGWIKPDRFDNIFVHGYTSSSDNIATTGTHQPSIAGFTDTFINKITKDGQKIWGTYYGGLYDDASGGVDFDQNDNIFVVSDIHIPNPASPGNPYYYFGQVALLKFNPDGTLFYEKIFGGNLDEITYDLKFYNNSIYIIGETFSDQNLSTPGAFQENATSINQQAGFVGKFKAVDGSTEWISYITGNAASTVGKIFNANNGIEIIATTRATDFPMVNAFQSTSHIASGSSNNNGLYLNFSENGSLLRSSYVGENESYYFESAQRFGDEIFFGAHVYTKKQASFFVANLLTNSVVEKNIPVINGLQTSTYIDSQRNLFVANYACSTDIGIGQVATPDAFMQTSAAGCSSHFMKYDENLNKLWGTFYPGHTQIPFIIKDNSNNIYFWGLSFGYSPGMTTPGTFQQTSSSHDDMFIAKFADCASNVNVSYTPTCINQNLQLNASGGTTYEWFGPNNFHSLLQNPVINNAQITDSGEYFVRITGGQSCGGIFSLIINIGSPTLPVLDNPNLPDLSGFCNVNITTIPTATTGCGTKITATTTDPLSYSTAGNYVIHWNYNDGQGNTLTQNQNVFVKSISLPTTNATQKFCLIDSPKISDLQISGTAVKWYDGTGNILNSTTPLTNGTKYFATQTLNSCESAKTEITVTLNDPNPPTGNVSQTFCGAQLPKISDILVTGQNIKWFDATGNILSPTTPLLDGKTYFSSQTVNGCESTQKLAVTVSVKNGGIPANDYAVAICNPTTSTTKIESLNDYKANLIANPGIYIFEFFDVNNQVIPDVSNVILNLGANIFNVKISNTLGCFDFVKLTLTLDPKPTLDLPESVEFCNGQSVTLDGGGNGLMAYEWTRTDDPKVISNNQILIVSTPGNYILKVENNFGCQNSTIIKVTQSIVAKIIGVQIVNNAATVLLSEPGNFEFSLDQISWQNSNIFSNLKNGNYTVHVRTKLGCIIGSENFTIFNVSNVFTPDADGINDTWKISGLENYPDSEVKIFDRFGTVVLDKITTGIFEWDGTFNSRKLPTGNYWYVIKVTDGRLLQGWLLVKNRN